MVTSKEQVLLAVVTVREMPGRISPSLPDMPEHALERLVVEIGSAAELRVVRVDG